MTDELEEYAKRIYGAACDVCNEFVILDKDSPNYEGKKLYKREHEWGVITQFTTRMRVCEDCLDAVLCPMNEYGIHSGPVVEMDDDEASHHFDSNAFWHHLCETIPDGRRQHFVLCPACGEVLYWQVDRQRFVDFDIEVIAVTLDDLAGKFDLDMTRVPVCIMSGQPNPVPTER